ncbi:hypothetical protein CPT03_08780 [Pedobacter ginsengisoli]|uniref:Uncharacterized protein n=1 Tax=Pedobacter ginsengisoli TaxID=363852 RepID=A0A2D1U4M9_9SPHI|nr:hypothetical protein [Pedobacter ginsengisoli]ATP56560.1 hypothetical protein CPT03_08780 [Pedobacter ginsengisoli]
MKSILPLFGLLLLLSACGNTEKMQLRAPEPQVAEAKTDSIAVIAKDSTKTDSAKTPLPH